MSVIPGINLFFSLIIPEVDLVILSGEVGGGVGGGLGDVLCKTSAKSLGPALSRKSETLLNWFLIIGRIIPVGSFPSCKISAISNVHSYKRVDNILEIKFVISNI